MVQEKFYPLTNKKFVEISSQLKDSELRVWLYISTLDNFGNQPFEIDTCQLAEILNYSRRTIQYALKRLDELELINLDLIRVKVGLAKASMPERDDSANLNNTRRTPVRQDELQFAKTNSSSPRRTPVRERSPEPAPEAESRSPKINKIIQDYLRSLSLEERENFFKFAKEKANALPNPPVLLKQWIEKNFEELYQSWQESKSSTEKSAPQDIRDHPNYQQELQLALSDGYYTYAHIDYSGSSLDRWDRRKVAAHARDIGGKPYATS